MSSATPRTIAVSFLAVLVLAILGLVGVRLAAPGEPERSYEIGLIAARYATNGTPGTTPVAVSWIIGDADPTPPTVRHAWKFTGEEPGWTVVPETLETFQQLADAVANGTPVPPLNKTAFTEEKQAGFLAVSDEREDFDFGAWPLWIEDPEGTDDSMIVVVVRRPDGARVAMPIRSATPGERCYAATTSRALDSTQTQFVQNYPIVALEDQGLEGFLTGIQKHVFLSNLKTELVPPP